MTEVSLDENGYLMATLPSNTTKNIPVIGFIAHLDTSPDLSGRHVTPRIIKNYDGNDIPLCLEENIILRTEDFPEVKKYIGQDLIVTNGKTLLGADDKAGIAEIISAMEYLIQHPEIKHGKIRVAFTPDEEIGQGKWGCRMCFRKSSWCHWRLRRITSWGVCIRWCIGTGILCGIISRKG